LPLDSTVAEGTGERLSRYGTVYDLVREVPGSLLTLAHHGSKAYSEGFDLVHRREAPRANAIWQADHAQLSILLLREDGQTARPWLTIVIDDYSRAIAGSEVIASLIRMSGGNFRLLTRLLTQIERVPSVNDLHVISTAVVEAARDSLVIGPG
jgi:hypothetical protein